MSVLLLSGGVDSFVLLRRECEAGWRPQLCLTFDYGQQHRREIAAAQNIMDWCRVNGRVHKLPPAAFGGSSLTGGGSSLIGSPTVVPGRNLAFLSIAVAEAVRVGTKSVLFGAHAGDAAIYPDCRSAFVTALSEATEIAYGVRIEAPFLMRSKRDIVELGKTLNHPYGLPLEMAWSCYEGGDSPCGKCGACVEREEAGA